MNNYELYHYGVPGMKWGVIRWKDKLKNREKRIIADRERRALVKDAKKVQAKADPGGYKMVYGKYMQKRASYIYPSVHIVDQYGKVKMSYIRGDDGDRYIAAGKKEIDKIDLSKYFINTENMNIEYDVYD